MATIAFCLCLALILVGAFKTGGKGKSKSEFLLAGRSAKALTVGASLAATCLGGSAVLGMVSRAYAIGWQAFWWLGAGALGLTLLGIFYVPYFQRDPDCVTLPDWLAFRAGTAAQRLGALLIAVMWIGVIAAQWVAAAAIIANVTPLGYTWSLACCAVLVAVYTGVGGQRAVLRTDRIQAFFILLAIAVPALILWLKSVPNDAPLPLPGSGTMPEVAPWQWLALFVTVGGMYVVGPDMFSRIRTAGSLKSARNGALLAALVVTVAGLLLTFIGTAAHGVIPSDVSIRDILPYLISHQLPSIPAAVLHAGVLAALMSSADTCLMTAASVVDRNMGLPKSRGDIRIRLLIGVIAVISAVVAAVNPRVIGNIMLAYAAFAGGLLVPLLALPFLHRPQQVLARPVAFAIVGGAITAVATFLLNFGAHPDFTIRLAATGSIGAIVSGAVLAVTLIFSRAS